MGKTYPAVARLCGTVRVVSSFKNCGAWLPGRSAARTVMVMATRELAPSESVTINSSVMSRGLSVRGCRPGGVKGGGIGEGSAVIARPLVRQRLTLLRVGGRAVQRDLLATADHLGRLGHRHSRGLVLREGLHRDLDAGRVAGALRVRHRHGQRDGLSRLRRRGRCPGGLKLVSLSKDPTSGLAVQR